MHHASKQHEENVWHNDVIGFPSHKINKSIILLEEHSREKIIHRNSERLKHQIDAQRKNIVVDVKRHYQKDAKALHEIDIDQPVLFFHRR